MSRKHLPALLATVAIGAFVGLVLQNPATAYNEVSSVNTTLTNILGLQSAPSFGTPIYLNQWSSPSHFGYIAEGTSTTPNTTQGPTFLITRWDGATIGTCGTGANGQNNSSCESALVVISNNTVNGTQVVSPIYAVAQSISGQSGSAAQAINGSGRTQGNAVSVATGAYLEGQRAVSAVVNDPVLGVPNQSAHGAEITGWNNTMFPASMTYNGPVNNVDGIWDVARGQSLSVPESSALHIGQGNTTGVWQEGVTINYRSVLNYGFNDESADATPLYIGPGTSGGGHAGWGLDASQATLGAGFLNGPGGSFQVLSSGEVDVAGVKVIDNAGNLYNAGVPIGVGIYLHPGYYTGHNQWYPASTHPIVSGAAQAANVVTCQVINIIPSGVTINALGVSSTANPSGVQGSAALYKADGPGHRPGTLIDYSAPFTYSGVTGQFPGNMNNGTDTLVGGAYWACFYSNGAPTNNALAANTGVNVEGWQQGSNAMSHVLSQTASVTGVTCTAGTNCGGTAAWSGATPAWGNMSAAAWTDVFTNNTTAIAYEVN